MPSDRALYRLGQVVSREKFGILLTFVRERWAYLFIICSKVIANIPDANNTSMKIQKIVAMVTRNRDFDSSRLSAHRFHRFTTSHSSGDIDAPSRLRATSATTYPGTVT